MGVSEWELEGWLKIFRNQSVQGNLIIKRSVFFLLFASKLPFNFFLSSAWNVRFAAEVNWHPADPTNWKLVMSRNPPGKCTTGGIINLISAFLSFSLFVLRLLESSMLNAEMKEGEILPPTIQRLMKGYNKYLRPFFDGKEAAAQHMLRWEWQNSQGKQIFHSEGFILKCCACMLLHTSTFTAYG